MHFNSFLEKHYLPDSLQNLKELLQELGIEQQLEKYIDDYFNNTKLSTIESTIVQLSFTIINFTTTINKSLTHLTDTKEAATNTLVELGIRLIKETYKASNLPKDTYFNTLRYTLQKVYFKYGWDFSVLNEVLNLDSMHNLTKQQITTNTTAELKGNKKLYFVWNEKNRLQLDFFIDDLHTHFKIKSSKSQTYLLFDAIKTDFKVLVPSIHLEAFVVLVKQLYDKEIILLKGGKGYWKYIKPHIAPPKNELHTTRDFNKLCDECLKNETRKQIIEKHIGSILQKYTGFGLLDN